MFPGEWYDVERYLTSCRTTIYSTRRTDLWVGALFWMLPRTGSRMSRSGRPILRRRRNKRKLRRRSKNRRRTTTHRLMATLRTKPRTRPRTRSPSKSMSGRGMKERTSIMTLTEVLKMKSRTRISQRRATRREKRQSTKSSAKSTRHKRSLCCALCSTRKTTSSP